MNRENLEKLATYLEGLPEDYSHFNMGLFVDEATIAEYLKTSTIQCGTAACAVGHGPAAGIALNEEELAVLLRPHGLVQSYNTWDDYSQRVFGLLQTDTRWEWMFGGGWCGHDDTPHGAAKRIRYVLEGREVPVSFDEEDNEVEFDSCYVTADQIALYNGETA